MQRDFRKRATDGAKALSSRVFLTLLAILTLCATPLGTSDLFAASSHLFERNAIEARHGDLPRRLAMPCGNMPTDIVETPGQSVSTLALVDDTPDAIGIESPEFVHCHYCEGSFPALSGLTGRFDAGFEARGPPLG